MTEKYYKTAEVASITAAGILRIKDSAQTADILVDSDGDMMGIGGDATLVGVPVGRAIVTIADSGDEVRYEARTDRAQQLDINAGTGAANNGGTIDASAETAPLVLIGNPDADGEPILMGGKGRSTIISGGGHTSLWGGTGNALLIGAEDSKDEFFFFGESGRDTISGFTAGTEDDSDVLNLFGSTVTNLKITEKGVEISTSAKSKLLIQGFGVNDKIQWVSGEAKGVAKIGARDKANTFTYEADVTNYFGGNTSDTLSVSGDSNSVWLDGIGSSIEIIDASRATGDNILAGSRESQTIKGGRGNTSLWGGAGGNDTLIGGSGYNEFYFGMGEGTDIITNSHDDDKIMLYNVKLSDLNAQATGMNNGNMVIALNDGFSLTIKDYSRQGAVNFQLTDGTYSYDRNTGSWKEIKSASGL